jgi:hypothetical protein
MTTRLREWTDEEKPELLPWRLCTGDPIEKRHWDKGSSSPDPMTQALQIERDGRLKWVKGQLGGKTSSEWCDDPGKCL